MKKFLKRQGSPKSLGSLEDFSERYGSDESLRRIVQDIVQIEQEIDEAMSTRRQLQKLVEAMYSGGKHVEFGDESISVKDSAGKAIGLVSLSAGEKHLLRIFVEALLAGESTILIDEPELSMHVDWQKDLIHSLRALNPNAQLIFATHSPEIMADVPDDKIFRI